jgi:serine/threonine protein kinase
MVGKSNAHYQITALLGQGGMGEVYRARDRHLDRDVALKIVPEAFATDPERLSRFEREAKVLASLNHTNIASIYTIARDGTWETYYRFEVPPSGYVHHEFPEGFSAHWVRVRIDKDAIATVYFVYT